MVKQLIQNNLLILIVTFGLVVRITCLGLPGFKIDVDDWFAWSLRLSEVGISNFYSSQFFSDYLPGYMYILYFLALIKNLLHLDSLSFYLLLKVPSILSELLIGIIAYKIVKEKSSKFYATLSSALIILNPAFIFNSSIWGQVDGVLTLFLVLAIYFLKQPTLVLSCAILSLSFLIKPQTIAVFPIFFFFLVKNFSFNNLIRMSLSFFVPLILISFPFFQNNPFFGLINLIMKTVNQYQYTSLFAYNFWGINGFWINDQVLLNNLTYQNIGNLLFMSFWTIIFFFYLRGRLSFLSAATLGLLAFFFLPTRVHERYLYPAIVFLFITSSFLRSRILVSLTIVLSVLHFLNLYFVYVYYNEIYLKLPKVFYNAVLYNFLSDNGKSLSLISTFIFTLISIIIIKTNEYSKKN
jgi:dolichyl-phosphate-mannose-protein mannosyltransferase